MHYNRLRKGTADGYGSDGNRGFDFLTKGGGLNMKRITVVSLISFVVAVLFIAGVFRPAHAAVTPVDWRTKGAVTGVKDQGSPPCNVSWAFAAVGTMEGCHQITTGLLISLSEQQLLDCSANQGAQCCEGTVPIGLQSVIDAGGIASESTYPYTGCLERTSICSFLGDAAGNSPDADFFGFTGAEGDNVRIRLVADGGTGSLAHLVLSSNASGPLFLWVDSGPLPLEVSATLPSAGAYSVSVVSPVRKPSPYSGRYCLISTGVTGPLQPAASVEQPTSSSYCEPKACRFSPAHSAAGIGSYSAVSPGSEAALQSAILGRPVAARLKIGYRGQILPAFSLYSSGIFTSTDCDDSVVQWVTIVGMNTHPQGGDYYIVKNSWGTGWGMSGYIWVAAGSNVCGIADSACYPAGCR
jgi:hypothetical protein